MASAAVQKLKILLVGKGGREHALAWKLTRSESVEHVYVVPGNGGTATLNKASNCLDVSEDDYPGLVELSKRLSINLVVVGPDSAVVGGLSDHFQDSGISCFCPSKKAAVIEGSKAYAKDFMDKMAIPTAAYRSFDKYDEAKTYLESLDHKVVIKADGLAAGKGVILPETRGEGQQALEEIMLNGKFGSAGEQVVIEEYLEGYEISVLTFSDGKSILSLPPGQDHKRALDGNKGLNTGGMGVYAPVPCMTREQMAEIDKTIIQRTIDGLSADDRPFMGMLFTGIIVTPTGPKVLEYNGRFGDPETQSLMLLLPDEGLVEVLLACVEKRLGEVKLEPTAAYACNITVAAGGYPESYCKGNLIQLKSPPEGVQIFHAGTEWNNGELRTAGGRVFSVAATGKTLQEAVDTAYRGVKSIRFDGMFYRKDIAAR
ncbi:HET domain-containing protein [Colletotrichum sojae]|uniref:phosphoribosylamine--glycine ligase n=1 Tax=Colletotrichum sojae TaxID=2175907 RepID=A0A8H6MUL5_9PEZI|nr:HET domain-containing protein [Colletotrichum sojae]